MQSPSAPPTLINVAGIAALTFIVACASHEVLGHGAACLAEGGRITLLTSVYFHCENAGVVTDLAGPFANLVFGFGAYVLLERRVWSANVRLLLVLTLAFNLFWLAGCMLVSAIASKSDFAYALRELAVDPDWLGRVVLGTLGFLVYWFGMRATSKHVVQGTPLAFSYAVAGIVSCGAALFFVGSVAPAVREAALESFGSAIGLLLLAGARSPRMSHSSPVIPHPSGYGWLGAGVLATIAFFLLLGRGLVVTGIP
jgi:hypothetical protein